jgi:hypothetical protein
MAGIAAIAIGGAASSASATESGSFENRLNGATIGLPLGAAPPPGLYTGLETAYLGLLSSSGGNHNGQATGNFGTSQLPAIAQAVPLLWVPGWNFWGATYTASVVQAFYVFTACAGSGGCTGGGPIDAGGLVYTNTFIQPINLSWKLGNSGWFIGTAFAFTPPDGTHQLTTPNPDYWTFEPSIAFSYLGSGWVLSANFFYDFNTRSQNVCCNPGLLSHSAITSGDLFYGDYTALYKFGKWTIGPVGYTEFQTTADTGGCIGTNTTTGATSSLCGRHNTAAAGGLIGYDFGPVDLQVWVTDNFIGQDSPDGPGAVHVWSRLGFKIWGPEAPHPMPLVSKN